MKASSVGSKPAGAELLNMVYRPIEELKLDPANPRLHGKKQIRQIANSIKTFGFNVPILTDRDDKVICGHGRLLACRELGWTAVPTLALDHLTPAQACAFMIADNRLSEIATWDDRLLAQQLKDLSLLDLNFNIEVTGFEVGEIDLRIASLDAMPEPDDDPADILPELAAGPPVSKIGAAWLLDHHRLLCGSALDAAAFAALMGEEHAAMVFSDPPYNVRIDGHASGLGAIHHRPFPMASGEMDRTEFTAFLGQALRNLASFSVNGPDGGGALWQNGTNMLSWRALVLPFMEGVVAYNAVNLSVPNYSNAVDSGAAYTIWLTTFNSWLCPSDGTKWRRRLRAFRSS